MLDSKKILVPIDFSERSAAVAPSAGLALHGVEGTGREEPLVQAGSRMPKRGIQALPLAGPEPIQ
jgi:hypothetical protein